MNTTDLIALLSLVASLLAFFRPEVSKALIKALGGIDFYPSERIEIGYGTFGPTIAIPGTMRSKYGTVFIRSISLQLTRCQDRSTHAFAWKAFRKQNFMDQTKTEIDLATAISVGEFEERRLDVVYADNATLALISPGVLKLRSELAAACNAKWGTAPDVTSKEFQDFTDAFRGGQNPMALGAFAKIQKENYWQEGSYELRVDFFVDSRRRPASRSYTFELDAEQEAQLGLNAVKIIDEALFKTGVIYNFAYPFLNAPQRIA